MCVCVNAHGNLVFCVCPCGGGRVITHRKGTRVRVRFLGFTREEDHEWVELYEGRIRPIFETRAAFVDFWKTLATGTHIDFRQPMFHTNQESATSETYRWRSGTVVSVTPIELVIEESSRETTKIPVSHMKATCLPAGVVHGLEAFSPFVFGSRELEMAGFQML